MAYSPIAYMNYQWTINLHDGYPPLHVLMPEEYIPPSLHTLCNQKPTMFHLGNEYFAPPKSYCPLETMGRIWKLQPMRKVRSVMTYKYSKHYLAIRDPSRHQVPIGKDANIMPLLNSRILSNVTIKVVE